MVERQVSHIQKETMALLPMLDHLIDDETDRDARVRLCFGLTANPPEESTS